MAPITPDQIRSLELDAVSTRETLLAMHFRAKSAHIGTGLSSIEILLALYRTVLGPDDKFILSKGHGASALYAVLHQVGAFSREVLDTYYQDGTLLPAHPAPNAFPEIVAATGSLGHGLPIASGLAYGHRLQGKTSLRTACLLSDGECNEGTVWESALFAGHHRLNNLCVIVDCNGLQGLGYTKDVLNMAPFADKWRAFGFDVSEVDGHSFTELHAALHTPSERPRCILARTVKGKGVSYMENTLEWHYLTMTPEKYALAQTELAARRATL